MEIPKLFHVNHDAKTTDVALLISRLLIGITLFLFSGAPKLANLPNLFTSANNQDVASGLLTAATLYATFALGICTLLVVLGLATRYAALLVTISLAGTGLLIDHALTLNYFDPGHNSHPEIVYLYATAFLALIFTGPGRFSLDRLLSK
jgi:putative oxidoreductase